MMGSCWGKWDAGGMLEDAGECCGDAGGRSPLLPPAAGVN